MVTDFRQPLSDSDKGQSDGGPLVSVVLPCLNEEEALPFCLDKIQKVFQEHGINGEIVVSDNGSTDKSVEIAESYGVNLTHQPLRGYGNAYLKGFAAARGKYLIMADADDTYDFNLIPVFLQKLIEDKHDFVTGSRYLESGDAHITFLHRWVGNPALTFILNALFSTRYSDVYCGYRAFTREAFDMIRPVSPGMEFNLELAINARLADLNIAEIPIVLGPRKGESKLCTFSDGWRSLRMMLLYCPNKVFVLPGFTFLTLGLSMHMGLLFQLFEYRGSHFGAVAGTVATILTVLGFQIVSLGLHVKTYSWTRRFDKDNRTLASFYGAFNLEAGLAIGGLLFAAGVSIISYVLVKWVATGMPPPLPHPELASFSASLIIIGVGTCFSSIFISAMSMLTKTEPPPPIAPRS